MTNEPAKIKQEIKEGYKQMLHFVFSLHTLDDAIWLKPMQPGKWSIAETVGHLLYWDRFILEQRLPVMQAGAVLPKVEVDVDSFNQAAATYARQEISKNSLIDEFNFIRESILSELAKREEHAFHEVMYTASQKEITLSSYINGMIEHDLHHLNQMKQFLSEQTI